MSTLGLSGQTDRTEGVWKSLFWPSIDNAQDADLAAVRGFWICFVLAFVSGGTSATGAFVSVGLTLNSLGDLAVFLFFFLGANGVRQSSLAASVSMFVIYLLETIFYFWASPFHFSFFRLIGLALLLTNLRAAVLISRWRENPLRQDDFKYGPERQNVTWRDKLVDRMPLKIWPWGRAVFYAIAVALIPLEALGIFQLIRHRS